MRGLSCEQRYNGFCRHIQQLPSAHISATLLLLPNSNCLLDPAVHWPTWGAGRTSRL